MKVSKHLFCFALAALLFILTRPVSAQIYRRDVIRGQINTDCGAAVVNALVLVTRLPDRAIFRGVSDGRGTFEIVVVAGTGHYVVYVAADSFAKLSSYRSTLHSEEPRDSVFVLNIVLTRSFGQELAKVNVTAERLVPERSSSVLEVGVGGVERPILGLSAATMPEQRGNLDALAITVPGVTGSATGLVALGISGQNTTTLNGLSFAGASVPRDIRFTTRVSTSTFDPARGWFGGAETAVQIEPGAMLRSLRASVTVDDQALQGGDRIASRTGQQYSSTIASIGGDGYTASDRVAYSFGVQASRKASFVVPPSSLDVDVLKRVGLSPDSASRATQSLLALGVPVGLERSGRNYTSTASILARFNTPEFLSASNVLAPSSLGLILYAYHDERQGVGSSPLSLLTRQSSNLTDVASAQILYSSVSPRGVSRSIRSSVSQTRDVYSPLLSYPSGDIEISSSSSDATTPSVLFGFGGADARSSSVRVTWETQWRTALYLKNTGRHLLEVTADARFDKLAQNDEAGSQGSFRFANVDALSQNMPSSFFRTLGGSRSRSGVWNGFAAVSDTWKPSPRLRVVIGLRTEGNYFTARPPENKAVTETFDVRNSFVPNRVNVSPRVGFIWRYSNEPVVSGYFRTALGQMPFVATGIVRGGIGKFVSIVSPALLAAPFASTGLIGSGVRIACFGSATPRPNWQLYDVSPSSVPDTCAPTSEAPSLTDGASSVNLVDHNYAAAESWRASIGWSARSPWLSLSLDATVAWNRRQPGMLDLNFDSTPKFYTSDEGRPVFVTTAGIVSSTGTISPTESRRASAFGRVLQARSDLSGTARQFVVSIFPNMRGLTGRAFTAVSYSFGTAIVTQRGFDNTTFGSPAELQSQRTDADTRHNVLAQAGFISRYATVSLFGRVSSGSPFTPLVSSDVNGDGLVNDRAFVFDPQKLSQGKLATDMQTLLTQAPSYARRCLESQLGHAAAANSCTGPWAATLNASVTSPRLPWHSAVVALSFFNLPSVLDQLIHRGHLAGWGNAALPDPILFTTSGFDVSRRAFLYRTNPKFGGSQGTASVSPFRINLDVHLDLGPSDSRQLVGRLVGASRRNGRQPRLESGSMLPRLRRSGPQPYRDMLELADSLRLSNEQIRVIERADAQLRARADSVWKELADWLVALPDRFDETAAAARQESATSRVWEISRQHVQSVLRPLLTSDQVALLPWPASQLLAAAKPITGIRFFDYRDP